MKSPVREESSCVGNVHAHFEECEVASSIWNRMTLFRSRSCMAVHALFAVVASAYGADYYLKNNATDFSIAESYTSDADGTQPATRAPGQEDEVVVPAGTFAISGESASFETLSKVKRVRPNDGAVLEFTISDDDTRTFNAPINWNAEVCTFKDGNAEADLKCYGKIVKKGGGTLILASSGNTTAGNYNQDYFTQIDLQQGTLKLPQNTNKNMGFGDLTMSAGTTLVTCGNMSNKPQAISTHLRSLNGDGTITNETGRSTGQTISPYARNLVQDNVFRGRICHPAKLWLTGRLTQYGNSTGITQPIVVEANANHLNDGYDRGYYSFENVALLGSSSYFQYYGTGGAMHYFGGEDATIAQDAYLYTRQYPASFDAGWHGGLNITGDWSVEADDKDTAVSKWVVLMGSNTVPCTISGDFIERTWSDKGYASPDGIPYTIFVDKRGSGTWRLAAERNHGGGFAIQEGCLQFESIAEKGMASSLGNSTNLTTACSARDVSSYRVDYAFSLGSADASAALAVFEFVGATSGVSRTRPLVLKGKGGAIRASGVGSARLDFGDVSALEAGETTLTIDGTNTLFNTISGIRDGKGKVNVIKAGDGDWYLSCSNTFSGDLAVNAGTLTVLGPKYTWFRFTVKQAGGSPFQKLTFRQLALYDANGIRQNIGLSVAQPGASDANTTFWPDSDSAGLAPGSFAFGSKTFRVRLNTVVERWVDQLFGDVNTSTTFLDGTKYSGSQFSMKAYKTDADEGQNIKKDNPSSWIPFVMRLANGAPEIVSYDILSYYNNTATNDWPKVATMEASIDGVNWDLVETNDLGEVLAEHNYDFSIPLGGSKNNSNKWFSDGKDLTPRTPSKATTPRPGAGFPIRGRVANFEMPLQNVRSVSVAAGATLKTETEVLINSLKIDVDGAGTMDGFTFAQNGIINVLSSDVQIDDMTQTIELPGEYVNCTGLENIARWNVEVNGIRKPSFVPRVVDGCIQIKIRGLVVSIR